MNETLPFPTDPTFPGVSDLEPGGVIDTYNSTTTVLGSSATFTGQAVDCSKFETIVVGVKTNLAGTLIVDLSPDGTNWDVSNSNAVVGGTALTVKVSVSRKYYRIRFTNNGVTTQSYLRLQSMLGSQIPDQTVNAVFDTSSLVPANTIDTDNSTTSILTAGSLFTGIGTDVHKYLSIISSVLTDAAGTFYIDFSPDGSNWDSTYSRTVTANSTEVIKVPVTEKYYRVRFRNTDVTDQTFIRLQTILGQQSGLLYKEGNNHSHEDVGNMIVAVRKDIALTETTDGKYDALSLDKQGRLYTNSLLDNQQLDAFSRLRISAPYITFDSRLINQDSSALSWDQSLTGTGTATYNANQSSITLAVAAGNDRVLRQTFRSFNYQPGRSQLIMQSGLIGLQPSSTHYARIGLYDDQNGLFFEAKNNTLYAVCRTYTSGSAVDTAVVLSSWNIDTFNGNGRSKIQIDLSKVQIFIIEFQWLAVGRVRFGFSINGSICWGHEMNHANVLSIVYMTNPNLPLRYEIGCTTFTSPASMLQICSAVVAEQGCTTIGGINRVVDRGPSTSVLTTVNDEKWYVVLAIRKKTTRLTVDIVPHKACVICDSTALYRWRIWLNPTVASGALFVTPIDVTNSAIQYSRPANTCTLTEDTGVVLESGYEKNSNSSTFSANFDIGDLRMGATIAGVSDVLVLAVSRVTGTTESFYGSLHFTERG